MSNAEQNGNSPAHPVDEVIRRDEKGGLFGVAVSAVGMTKREAFTMAAMQGILSNSNESYTARDAAIEAVDYADATLAALEANNE